MLKPCMVGGFLACLFERVGVFICLFGDAGDVFLGGFAGGDVRGEVGFRMCGVWLECMSLGR